MPRSLYIPAVLPIVLEVCLMHPVASPWRNGPANRAGNLRHCKTLMAQVDPT